MERNVTLDFVRGVAILGILLLNISAFGLQRRLISIRTVRRYYATGCMDTGISRSHRPVKFLTLFALLFGAGLQMLLPRGRRWIQSRLTLLVLLGFIHGLLFWDGDILLAYGLVGLICWRLVRDAPSVKSLFNTGVMLYLVGLGVLLLLGLISDSQTSRARTPDASAILYEKYWKLHGGVEAINNRADGVGNSLLALGAQYGWQLAGMMLIGAALMRSGWLKGQFSLRHYRRTGFVLVAIGVIINLPAIALQWQLDWAYRWCAFLLQMPRELSAPFQAIGYASLFYGFWSQLSRFKLVLAIACVGRMALTNYLLQTLICTTLFTTSVCLCSLTVWSCWRLLFRYGWRISSSLLSGCVTSARPVEWLWRQLTLRAAGPTISKTSR